MISYIVLLRILTSTALFCLGTVINFIPQAEPQSVISQKYFHFHSISGSTFFNFYSLFFPSTRHTALTRQYSKKKENRGRWGKNSSYHLSTILMAYKSNITSLKLWICSVMVDRGALVIELWTATKSCHVRTSIIVHRENKTEDTFAFALFQALAKAYTLIRFCPRRTLATHESAVFQQTPFY